MNKEIISQFCGGIFTLFIILIIIAICSGCSHIQKVPAKTIDIATNDKFLDWAASTCLQLHSWNDATADAVNFAQGRQTYDADWSKWHIYKNSARGYLYMYGFIKGLKVGKGIKDNEIKKVVWREFKRSIIGDCPLAFTLWQSRYKYVRYKKFPDYSYNHNSHRYVVPIGKDNYLPINKPYIHGIVDLGMLSCGIYTLKN